MSISIGEFPEIAVIIPTYNRASALQETLASVFAQTRAPKQIIVADDGSTDGTTEVLRPHKNTVLHLRLPHSGRPAVARNKGLEASTMPLVAFLDSDDTWDRRFLELQSDIIQRRPMCMLYCSNALSLPSREPMHKITGETEKTVDYSQLLWTNIVVASSAIARRSDVIDAGGFPEDPKLRAVEDYALWLKLSLRGLVHYCSEPLCFYQANSQDSIRNGIQRAEAFLAVQRAVKYADCYARANNLHKVYNLNTRIRIVSLGIRAFLSRLISY